jgi:hypothetical protein
MAVKAGKEESAMAKRTKRKRAATGRSRAKAKRSPSKASGGKPAARSGTVKPRSASSGERTPRRASGVAPRRGRADDIGIDDPGTGIVEIPTDPARFDSDAPPDAADRARQVADSMVGDEEPGGTVMMPEHDSVDEYAAALGVERSPDSPVRSSEEILHERDERRRPGGPDREDQRRTI